MPKADNTLFKDKVKSLRKYLKQHDWVYPSRGDSVDENRRLGTFVDTQRTRHREGKLYPHREQILTKLDENFFAPRRNPPTRKHKRSRAKDPDAIFKANVDLLRKYLKKHGFEYPLASTIKARDQIGRHLVGFVGRQRRFHRKGELSKLRINLLKQVDKKFFTPSSGCPKSSPVAKKKEKKPAPVKTPKVAASTLKSTRTRSRSLPGTTRVKEVEGGGGASKKATPKSKSKPPAKSIIRQPRQPRRIEVMAVLDAPAPSGSIQERVLQRLLSKGFQANVLTVTP